MISYTAARELLIRQARSFGKERIGLEAAYGRVLSETIRADRDYPPFDRSSVDGYAIRAEDLEAGLRSFTIIEAIFAGSQAAKPIHPGECYKIMTGASVPPGADAVIKREDTEEQGWAIFIGSATCRPFQYISRKGEDIRSGEELITGPSRCEPALMGLLASLGKSELTVERLPRVALLTTGNEVMPVGAAVNAVQIRNSNRWVLQSFLKKWGITPAHYAHLPDDRAALLDAMKDLVEGTPEPTSGSPKDRSPLHSETGSGSSLPDLLILTGGVSAGDADHVPAVLEELGVQRLFHKIAIKPGKPVWCGITPGGKMLFALPGNPFSCLVGFVLLIQPWLTACFGLPVPEPLGLPLRVSRKKGSNLDEFFPVRMEGSPAGLQPVALNGSGDIRLAWEANALALHPVDCPSIAEGAITTCYPF